MELQGVREIACRDRRARFAALLHHITPSLLTESFYALRRQAAVGIDGVTWQEYETILHERGTPQGGVISPLLANIYLHYVFDLWAHQWRRRAERGDVIIVRYADDNVVGFQYENQAKRFLASLRKRLSDFGLTLHPEKTRLIQFGRFAAQDRSENGQAKPKTFDFLGFTHCCGRTRQGQFQVIRLTVKKRMRATLDAIRTKLMSRRHEPISVIGKWLRRVVQGYFNYHAVPVT